MKSRFTHLAILVACIALAGMLSMNSFAGDKDKSDKSDKSDKAAASAAAFEALKTLEGTWVMTEAGPNGKVDEVVFKPTAGGSAMMETMFPGSKHEMLNAYHMDGDNVIVTHYCARRSTTHETRQSRQRRAEIRIPRLHEPQARRRPHGRPGTHHQW